MSVADDHRADIESALKAGVTVTEIALNVGIPRSTLDSTLVRWRRPAPPANPVAQQALERLKKAIEE